jgi:hypothetical protein
MEFETCTCRASLWRAVLFARGATSACMACGHVRMLSFEWIESDNPHVDRVAGPTHSLALDVDTAPWLGAFPRVADGLTDVFIPATVRATDAEALSKLESELAAKQPTGIAARLRLAGIPGAPIRRDMRMEVNAFMDVFDALALDDSASVDIVMNVMRKGPLAVSIAEELLATPRLSEALVTFIEVGRAPLPHALVWRVIRLSEGARRDAFGAALAVRLARLVPALEAEESDVGETLDALGGVGRSAAPARASLEACRASALASRRSTMRDALDRIFANIA